MRFYTQQYGFKDFLGSVTQAGAGMTQAESLQILVAHAPKIHGSLRRGQGAKTTAILHDVVAVVALVRQAHVRQRIQGQHACQVEIVEFSMPYLAGALLRYADV